MRVGVDVCAVARELEAVYLLVVCVLGRSEVLWGECARGRRFVVARVMTFLAPGGTVLGLLSFKGFY